VSYPAGTFVLTPDGWKTVEQVKHSDRVAEMDDNELVFNHPADVVSKHFSGQLVHAEARNYEFVTTPDHLHTLVDGRNAKVSTVPSSDLHKQRHKFVRVGAPMARREREVHDPDFARLVGMMRSNMLIFNRTHILSRIKLSTIRPYMAALMDGAGVSWTKDEARFKIERHPRIMAYFTENRRLRRSTLLALDNESRRLFLHGLQNWNARIRPPAFSTEICRLPHDEVRLIHELAARTGISSVERLVKEKWIHVKIRPEQRNLLPQSLKMIDYSGRVYALAMPSGTLLTRTNHKPALTGDGFNL
jgi:hypothetical protein